MLVFFLSVYLKDHLHFDLETVGQLMACYGAGAITGTMVGGKLTDVLGYRPVMIASLLLGGAAFFWVEQLTNGFWLSIGLFALSFLSDAFRPANMAAVSGFTTKDNYLKSVTLTRLAVNLGFSIGPAIGGLLAQKSYSWIYWADGATCILAALIVLFFLRPVSLPDHAQAERETSSGKGMSPYRDGVFLRFLPLVCLYAICFFQFFSTMPMYYKDAEHFSEAQIGTLMALNGLLVVVVEMGMIAHLQKKGATHRFIQLGAFLLVISYALVTVVHGYAWYVVLIVLISFSEMFAMPFMNTIMNNRAAAGMLGQYAALYAVAWAVAQILTPLLVTQTVHHFGYNALWIEMALMAAMVAYVFRKPFE